MSKPPSREETARKVHSTALHLMRYVRAQDIALGVPPARLSALSVIVFGGKTSLSDLAKAEQVRPPTMSRNIEAFVRGGEGRSSSSRGTRSLTLRICSSSLESLIVGSILPISIF